MNTTELLEHHLKLCARAQQLMERKNADYAGADGETPFKNFQTSEALGLCTTEVGMAIRLSDKLQRLSGFLVNPRDMQVKDESLDDTILDGINYLVLISAYLKQKRGAS